MKNTVKKAVVTLGALGVVVGLTVPISVRANTGSVDSGGLKMVCQNTPSATRVTAYTRLEGSASTPTVVTGISLLARNQNTGEYKTYTANGGGPYSSTATLSLPSGWIYSDKGYSTHKATGMNEFRLGFNLL